jgi:predicted RNA-binding protein with PUA-like domain
MSYWLVKSEPSCFSIDDLICAPQQTTSWDGVRNYQARNFMKDMKIDDKVFFYHSNCQHPGIVGITKVVQTAYPDHTAWDPLNEHYDPKSLPSLPRWFMVDLQFEKKFLTTIKLQDLYHYKELEDLALVKRGNRLSVMPIQPPQWKFILSLVG